MINSELKHTDFSRYTFEEFLQMIFLFLLLNIQQKRYKSFGIVLRNLLLLI